MIEIFLLGITYDFTNLSEEATRDIESAWANNVSIAQVVNEQELVFEVRDEVSSEEGESQVELSIVANESVTQTVYYELESIEVLAV